jgi:hypothetical protein
MRFRIGPQPKDDTIDDEPGTWHLVHEPSAAVLQLSGLFTAVIVTACIALVVSISIGAGHVLDVSWLRVILFVILVMPFHELIHATGFEGGVTSKRVVFGFDPKVFGFYVHYSGVIPRDRYIAIAALPFITITLLPLIIVVWFGIEYTYLTEIIFSNGLASALDVLTVILILRQVPRQSVLVNSGLKSYWKPVVDKSLALDAG